jgi:hypothetical protein
MSGTGFVAVFAPDLKLFRTHVMVARKVVRLNHSREMRALR